MIGQLLHVFIVCRRNKSLAKDVAGVLAYDTQEPHRRGPINHNIPWEVLEQIGSVLPTWALSVSVGNHA